MAPTAQAQYNFLDPFQSGLDRIVRGLDYIGDRASELLGPGLGIGEDKKSAYTASRATEAQYPVGTELVVSLENEFGLITVNTWPERTVKIETEIFVGAQTEQVAEKILSSIEIHVEQGEKNFDIRTFLPDTRRESGLDSIEVHYKLLIPNTAGFTCKNFFGDTSIRAVGGPLTVDAQYGQVELNNINAPVRLRMLGEFPLRARGLRKGGVFNLSGALGDFSELQGEYQISNFRGGVNLHSITQDADITVNSDSGIIQMLVPSGIEPDISATAVYGAVEGSHPMTRVVTGSKTLAYSRNADATQRIALNAAFGGIRVDRVGASGQKADTPARDTQAFNDNQTESVNMPEGFTLEVNATIGDIHVEGGDTETLHISATRIVWVKSASQAPAALDALRLDVQALADRVAVRTLVTQDMEGLECSAYRVDLRIVAPRTLPLQIFAENGFTAVKGMEGSVRVNQSAGDVAVQNNTGPQTISNQNGNISASGCGGDVDVSTRYGSLSLSQIKGKTTANCSQGDTIIETLLNDAIIRTTGGDVRILALEGIPGALDVLVVRGDLRILMPESADIELEATAKNGQVRSRIPLTGSITQDTQEFRTILKDGRHRVRLAAHDGHVILD